MVYVKQNSLNEVNLNVLEEEEAIEEALENPVPEAITPHHHLLGDDKKEVINVHSGNIRWVALGLCAFSCIGNFFFNVLMGTLQTDIREKWHITLTEFNATNSLGSIPGIILPLLSGIIINRVGLKTSFAISSFICCVANAIITYGVTQANLTIILIGNVVSTLGESPLGICRNAMLVKWFVGKELSFALGFVLCINRFGSSICSFTAPSIYKAYDDLAVPFYIGMACMAFSFLNTLGLAYVDRTTDNHYKREFPELAALKKKTKKPISLRDLKDFKLIYFVVVCIVGFMYMAVFGFITNGNDILQKRFNFNSEEAGRLMTIIYLCPLFVTPVMGAVTDKIGKRTFILFIAAALIIVTHLAIAIMPDAEDGEKKYSIIVGLLAIGIEYSSFAAVIWPCVALTVSDKLTGLAYGVAGSFSAALASGYPTLLGYIHDKTELRHGYFWTQIFLVCAAFIGLVAAAFLYRVDSLQNHGKLNKPGTERKMSVRERVYSQTNLDEKH